MSQKIRKCRFCFFSITLYSVLVVFPALADRNPPEPIDPVEKDGVRYEVVHWGNIAGYQQNGGIVEAYNAADDTPLWSVLVYTIEYNPDLEGDVQDIFITQMSLEDGYLEVKNERGGVYHINLADQSVETIEGASSYRATIGGDNIEEAADGGDVEEDEHNIGQTSDDDAAAGCSMTPTSPFRRNFLVALLIAVF